MQPALTSMYTRITGGTASVAIVKKPLSGPHFQPKSSATTSANNDIQMIATFGVLKRSCTRPSGRGARPLRAREQKRRVAALTAAFEVASTGMQIARKQSTQMADQHLLPSQRTGAEY